MARDVGLSMTWVLVISFALLATPLAVEAQPPGAKAARIGYLSGLSEELVALGVDLIVSVGGPTAARAAKAATTSIPIVFVSGRAVEAGIVSNLARPGGNLTGFDVLLEELDVKRLELLKEM